MKNGSIFDRVPGKFLAPRAYLTARTTIGFAVFVAAVWGFSALLDAVLDNALLVRWDRATSTFIDAHGTERGEAIFNMITQLGSPVVYALMALVAIFLWQRKQTLLLITWLAANVGGKLIEFVLKRTVRRTRPIYAAEFIHSSHSYSFPSGHALGSAVCYIMLVFVLSTMYHLHRRTRVLAYVGAIVLIGVIGFSRIYTGVHYASDVLGGYLVGAAWLAVCLTGYAVAHQRTVDGAAELPV